MQYHTPGSSSMNISRIGFGCMSLKRGQPGIDQVIHAAVDYGINYFDTADLYDKGQNEIAVGKALQQKRQQVFIATKGGNQWRPDGSGWDWNPRKEYLLAAVEQSLKRLQTDYIDLYQLHGGTIDDPIEETIEAFEILIQQGKIKYYGISSIRPNVIQAYADRSTMISVMMQYSLLDRRPEESCMQLLQNHQVGILARGSVAGGLLVNKTARPYLDYDGEQVRHAADAIQDISGTQRSPAQSALQFVLHNAAVASAIVGIRTMEQLEEAVTAIDSPPLSEVEMQILRQSVPVNYYTAHR
jgi:aryl-alcohol dehydrogenase-like predicted oxidoreductase